jgi:hypothetical protein
MSCLWFSTPAFLNPRDSKILLQGTCYFFEPLKFNIFFNNWISNFKFYHLRCTYLTRIQSKFLFHWITRTNPQTAGIKTKLKFFPRLTSKDLPPTRDLLTERLRNTAFYLRACNTRHGLRKQKFLYKKIS